MPTINIDGIEYVPKDECVEEPNYEYVIVRSDRAGVFAGYLKNRDGDMVTLSKCRKLWYWSGANTVQEIAKDGVANPGDCKFTVVLAEQLVFGVIELLPCTTKAQKSIMAVQEWKQ